MFIPTSTDKRILIPQKGDVISLWRDAVRHGEAHANVTLSLSLEKHLIMILMEYLHDVHLMDIPIAIHFLEGLEKNDLTRLSRAASTALLILGLFPERTNRMLVSSSYLLATGQSSYDHLALRFEAIRSMSDATLARKARDAFEPMARVLRGMRMEENIFTLPI